MIKFTIIIPTYNYGHYITYSLESVLKQTYTNWECLIIDNASTDSTEQICKNYLIDNRFIYYKLLQNKGPAIARNYALKKATGTYILFLDADDLIEINKLKRASIIINKYNSDFIFTNYSLFDDNNNDNIQLFKQQFSKGIINCITIQHKLIYSNIFAISCIISNISILKQINYFDESLSYNEDWDLWLRSSLQIATYFYDDSENSTTLIRNHNNSYSKNRFLMYVSGLVICKKNYNILNSTQKKIFIKKILSHRYEIKYNLIKQYNTNMLDFDNSVLLINSYKILQNEFTLFIKLLRIIPSFFISLYVNLLKIQYFVISKCL